MFDKNFITFPDCRICVQASDIEIRFVASKLTFEHKNKPSFNSQTGEIVTEYTGLAVDNNYEFSWAKAEFAPKGSSTSHMHKERTEDYYITSGVATLTIDGKAFKLSSGEHIKILPGQVHHVLNESEDEKLVIIVKCVPAWTINDFHLAEQPKFVPEQKY
jgi:mannose-6-phosphate isomerase-like protein (cupin superfamily)